MVSYHSVIKWYEEQGSILNYTDDGGELLSVVSFQLSH